MENYFELIFKSHGLNHIAIQIFTYLDVISLLNCKLVSQAWNRFMLENKSIWIPQSRKTLKFADILIDGYQSRKYVKHIETKSTKEIIQYLKYGLHCCVKTNLGFVGKHGPFEIVKLMIEFGGKSSEFLNARDANGETFLHKACNRGNAEAVEFFLEFQSINVNAISKIGMTPLHYACFRANADIVEILSDNPKLKLPMDGTYFTHLCYMGYNAIIVKLLDRFPYLNINAKDNMGNTPLHIACKNGNAELIGILWQNPFVDLKIRDSNGCTAVQRYCSKGQGSNKVDLEVISNQFTKVKITML